MEELGPDLDDPFNRIGAGQLWVLHKTFAPALQIPGGPQIYVAHRQELEMVGILSFDPKTLHTRLELRATWALARSKRGEEVD